MKERNIAVICEGQVDPRRIPEHIGMNLAQAALRGILRDYQDPKIQEEYRRWKTQRAGAVQEARA